ncbi:hypothetical protein [Nonomuraea dietziae]|uniref:hypothetical protein n=1 Tax=Nonomuraea dietziae TaxID=65515 RepID=UPI0031D0575D
MPSSLRTLEAVPASAPASCESVTRRPSAEIACPSAHSRPACSRRACRRSGRRWRSFTMSVCCEPGPQLSPSATLSCDSVSRATRHPPSTSPTTRSSGTKTSSRKTSLKSSSPLISFNGRTVTPGAAMSTRK